MNNIYGDYDNERDELALREDKKELTPAELALFLKPSLQDVRDMLSRYVGAAAMA